MYRNCHSVCSLLNLFLKNLKNQKKISVDKKCRIKNSQCQKSSGFFFPYRKLKTRDSAFYFEGSERYKNKCKRIWSYHEIHVRAFGWNSRRKPIRSFIKSLISFRLWHLNILFSAGCVNFSTFLLKIFQKNSNIKNRNPSDKRDSIFWKKMCFTFNVNVKMCFFLILDTPSFRISVELFASWILAGPRKHLYWSTFSRWMLLQSSLYFRYLYDVFTPV